MGFSEADLVTPSCETISTESVDERKYLLDNLNLGQPEGRKRIYINLSECLNVILIIGRKIC